MALYTFLSPLVLARALDPAAYSAYILGAQIVPFLLILATPIQASLAPKFAHYIALGTADDIARLLRVAMRYFLLSAGLAVGIAIAFSLFLPDILGWHGSFAVDATKSVICLGVAAALTFPAFVITTYAAGHQNFAWDNILKCLGPYAGLALVTGTWLLAAGSEGLLSLDWILELMAAATILAACAVLSLGARRLPPKFWRRHDRTSMSISFLWHDVKGAYWWQICALLSVGMGPFLVSSISTKSVAPFAIAGSMMTVIAGVSSAMAGPFSVKMADQVGSKAVERRALFGRFQRPFVLFLSTATAFLLLIPRSALSLWVGKHFGSEIADLLIPLALGNYLRQITAPYTMAVLGLGMQRKLWLSPTAEMVSSVVFGYLLGQSYGALGVAYGLLMGALVRLTLTLFYDLRLTYAALPLSAVDLCFPWRHKQVWQST